MDLITLFCIWASANVNNKYVKLRQKDLESYNLIYPSYYFDAEGKKTIVSLGSDCTIFIDVVTKQRIKHYPYPQHELELTRVDRRRKKIIIDSPLFNLH